MEGHMIRLAILIAFLALPASAQSLCSMRGEIISVLSDRYHEEVQHSEQRPEGLLEFHANTDTGTWTLTITRGPITCVVQHGTGYEAPNEGDPA